MYRLISRGQDTPIWQKPDDMPPLIHRLLMSRGIASEEEARAFLHPDETQFHDPLLLKGMDRAVSRVNAAREANEAVCIWGDYDVDGICASSILKLYLTKLGMNVTTHIPKRHEEGYGLNEAGIREEAARARLLITVDCGISCRNEVALARQLGMDVIVTDHHRPGDNIPDGLVINPLLGGYPCEKLCGAGVAFKLVHALGGLEAAMEYVDLAAMATVADLVPLTGENRVIVSLGLKAINREPRLGVKLLIARAELTGRPIGAGNIGFQLAPRLNAGGRLGDAARGLELLTTSDPARAAALADELNEENNARKSEEKEIVDQCLEMMKDYSLIDHRIIVLCGRGWNSGVIGLAASHLAQAYHYPVALFSEEDGVCVGSCRSIPAVDIYQALCSVADLLTRFGGHRQAAGLTMPREHLDEFLIRLDDYLFDNTRPGDYIPEMEYDIEWPLSSVDLGAVRLMDELQPTGFGNPSPVFMTNAYVESARAVGRDGAHLQMRLMQDESHVQGVFFGHGALAEQLSGTSRTLLYAPSVNEWRGQVSVQCEVKSMLQESAGDVFARFEAKYPRFLRAYLTDLLYNGESNNAAQAPAPMYDAELIDCLKTSLQGNTILCATLEGAKKLYTFLKANGLTDRADACAGRVSDDAASMNAICLCPVGPAEGRWRRVILWDAPKEAFAALPAGELFASAHVLKRDWLNEIPTISDLRRAFMCARLFARSGVARVTAEDLERDMARSTGLAPGPGLQMSLAVLNHMGLVEYDPGAARLTMPPAKKAEPTDDTLYQRLLAIQKGVI